MIKRLQNLNERALKIMLRLRARGILRKHKGTRVQNSEESQHGFAELNAMPKFMFVLRKIAKFLRGNKEYSSFFIARFSVRVASSSVARGKAGGLEPPHWLVKYAKSHVFGAFEADFW